MRLARVIGTVTSTAKIEAYRGQKLLLIRPIDPDGVFAGGAQIAIDRAQSGAGDDVLLLDEGNSARMMLRDSTAPVRAVIVGVVDHVERTTEEKHGR